MLGSSLLELALNALEEKEGLAKIFCKSCCWTFFMLCSLTSLRSLLRSCTLSVLSFSSLTPRIFSAAESCSRSMAIFCLVSSMSCSFLILTCLKSNDFLVRSFIVILKREKKTLINIREVFKLKKNNKFKVKKKFCSKNGI